MAILAATVGRKAALWKEKGTRYLLDASRHERKRTRKGMNLPLEELPPQVLLLQVSDVIISGQAILLASADNIVPTTVLAAFEASTDPIYTSMSDADSFKYDTLFLEDHSTSINWHERRRTVSAGDALIASINTNTCTTLFIHAGPFILDSGATIHISPDASDFFKLKPIPPRTIKGIGGSSINATGIGRIRLCIRKGLELTLEPVLFVPEASVQLISVFVLSSGPQKLISHFDGDGCWLTNTSETTIASGKISAMGQ
jgi:hypothetical protein